MNHTDANVQPQGNPWDGNEPDWDTPLVLPARALPGLTANPLREYLEAMGRELLISKGEVRQVWKEAMALTLEHSYGVEPHEAQAKVESAVRSADEHLKEDKAAGLEWDEIKDDRARDLVTWMVLR